MFDWIIIDTPPVGQLLPDANLLAAMLDGAVFVVAAGRTPCASCRRPSRRWGGDRILGVVLNRVDAANAMPGNYYYALLRVDTEAFSVLPGARRRHGQAAWRTRLGSRLLTP